MSLTYSLSSRTLLKPFLEQVALPGFIQKTLFLPPTIPSMTAPIRLWAGAVLGPG